MKKKVKALIYEKDKLRGLVPSRAYGNKDKVYTAYLRSLNVRENEQVQLALASSTDNRHREFLARITENRYKKVGLAVIAKACGIDLMEFANWWNGASTQQAIAIAQTSTINLTKDMVIDAASVETVCERCDGLAFVAAPPDLPDDTPGYRHMKSGDEVIWIRTCPLCVNGKVRKPGDTHARDKILEMSGIIRKGAGVNINLNNFGGAAHTSAIADLDEAMSIDI